MGKIPRTPLAGRRVELSPAVVNQDGSVQDPLGAGVGIRGTTGSTVLC